MQKKVNIIYSSPYSYFYAIYLGRLKNSIHVENFTNFIGINPKLVNSIILGTEISRWVILYIPHTDEQFSTNRAKIWLIQNYTEHHLPFFIQVAL